MKNPLKIVFGIALIGLFSIGCKKDSTTPVTRQPVAAQKVGQAKFTVSSTTFKDGVNYSQHWGLKSPQISCKDVPAGTKILVITMKDNAVGSAQHTYWTSFAAPGVDLKEKHSLKEWSAGDFRLPGKDNGATECILEVVAMKALGSVDSKSDILGVTTATYKIVKHE